MGIPHVMVSAFCLTTDHHRGSVRVELLVRSIRDDGGPPPAQPGG
jgi:hypothetical protein